MTEEQPNYMVVCRYCEVKAEFTVISNLASINRSCCPKHLQHAYSACKVGGLGAYVLRPARDMGVADPPTFSEVDRVSIPFGDPPPKKKKILSKEKKPPRKEKKPWREINAASCEWVSSYDIYFQELKRIELNEHAKG